MRLRPRAADRVLRMVICDVRLSSGLGVLLRSDNAGYINAQESMRLRPVAAGGFVRVVVRDLRLSNGLVLPRGAMLTGSNLATLNSPAFWDQPQRFLPVRPAGAKLHITSLILFPPDSLQPLRVSVFLSSSVAAARGHADRLQCDHRQQPRCL